MSASRALTKKKDMLLELAFSGCHAKQSVWVLVQKYNTICKDLREQTKWIALFQCKDQLSFTDALDENDIVPHERRSLLHTSLAEAKHTKINLLLISAKGTGDGGCSILHSHMLTTNNIVHPWVCGDKSILDLSTWFEY